MGERQRQDQLRESMEQISLIKKELRSMPHLEVLEKIGSGSFGDIFKVWDSRKGCWAAVKFEKRDRKNKISHIKKEAQIMQQVRGSRYFAVLYDRYFNENSPYSFIEMSFLGTNLENLKKRATPHGKFTLRTVMLIAGQMLSALQILHEKGIIHRDIKPENFVIGSEGAHHQLYTIDFGLSKYYLQEDGQHIPIRQNKGLIGTARYTSVGSHSGIEQSRRDDLEAVAYLLLYFAKGTLIWQNLQVKDKDERFRKIAELKHTTSLQTMCKGLPNEFLEYLMLVKALGFQEKPDYERYKQLFSSCYANNFTTPEHAACFDWCPKNCLLSYKATGDANLKGTPTHDMNSNLSSLLTNLPSLANNQSLSMLQQQHVLNHQPQAKSAALRNQVSFPQTSVEQIQRLKLNGTSSQLQVPLSNSTRLNHSGARSSNLQALWESPISGMGTNTNLQFLLTTSNQLSTVIGGQTNLLSNADNSFQVSEQQQGVTYVYEMKGKTDKREEIDDRQSHNQAVSVELKADESIRLIPVFRTEKNSMRYKVTRSIVDPPKFSERLIFNALYSEEGMAIQDFQPSMRLDTMPSLRHGGWVSPSDILEDGQRLANNYNSKQQRLNQENFKFVNNDSNEWNSMQEEKVAARHVPSLSMVKGLKFESFC